MRRGGGAGEVVDHPQPFLFVERERRGGGFASLLRGVAFLIALELELVLKFLLFPARMSLCLPPFHLYSPLRYTSENRE